MSNSNDTKKIADEIGRLVIESMLAEEKPEQAYLDFRDYQDYLKTVKNSAPDADAIFGPCSIDGIAGAGIAYK